jgi:hypothetical protein
MIMGLEFTVSAKVPGFLLFKDSKKRSNYSLYYSELSEDQILEVARIIDEVYKNNNRDNRGSNREVPTVSLNGVGDLSREFVTTVLNLNGSSLHKFLLLTSGYFLASSGSDRIVIELAVIKPESCGDPTEFFTSKYTSDNLTEFYILPGITDKSSHQACRMLFNSAIMRHEISFIAKLLFFIANNSPTAILGEHLELDNATILQMPALGANMETFSAVEAIIAIKQEYAEFAYTLTAEELRILGYLLHGEFTKIPTDFLKSRVKAMASLENNRHLGGWLISYLSPLERNASSSEDVEKISEELNKYYRGRGGNPTILFASIAEVFVRKGYRKTFDVLSEIKVIFNYPSLSLNIVEATVLLILEAIKPENDEMPFSWAMQFNENAWVLQSHKAPSELSLQV